MAATFRTERDGRVLVVLLDNAPLHLIDRRMVDELTALVRQVERDSTIGSIVVTGAERGRFVTHYDVAEMLAGAEGVGLRITPTGAAAASRSVAGVSMIRVLDALSGDRPSGASSTCKRPPRSSGGSNCSTRS